MRETRGKIMAVLSAFALMMCAGCSTFFDDFSDPLPAKGEHAPEKAHITTFYALAHERGHYAYLCEERAQ